MLKSFLGLFGIFGVILMWLIVIALAIGWPVALIYIIYHFAHKYW